MENKKKLLIIGLVLFTYGHVFAQSGDVFSAPSTSDYVTEAGTVLIEGAAAGSLYLSLKAKEVKDTADSSPFAFKKENKFARCKAVYDNKAKDRRVLSAKCQITAPKNTVDTY